MPLPFLAIGAALGAANAVGKFFTGNKQNKFANEINPNYTPYQTSQYAKQNLGAVQQMFNSRMPGSAIAGRGIEAAQANQLANIQRNATDSSTALALGNAAQGQAGQSFNELGMREGQYKAGLLDNLQSAYGQLVGEDRFKYQDMLNKYQLDANAKAALRQSAMQNKFGAVNDIASLGIKLGTGGFGLGNSKKALGGLGGSFQPKGYDQYGSEIYLDPYTGQPIQ